MINIKYLFFVNIIMQKIISKPEKISKNKRKHDSEISHCRTFLWNPLTAREFIKKISMMLMCFLFLSSLNTSNRISYNFTVNADILTTSLNCANGYKSRQHKFKFVIMLPYMSCFNSIYYGK